ncbi:transposase [Synechococcus sp. PCC 6312]|uniref:transposase n=1 Tax=Synechococcus sp. (strain ATCC 27167 / PCC 6312) TaxID=195253 RepID=UPI0009FF5387
MIKYLLLRNHSSLTKGEKQNLEYALDCSKKLRLAYELKEEFRSIYETDQPPDKARVKFERWMEKSSQLFHASSQIIKNHIDGICNYFGHRTTSGLMEGINNKIKVIKRQAYGFTNFRHLRMRLMACFSH